MRQTELRRTAFKRTMPTEPKPSPGPRKRTCKACKTKFQPFRSIEAWCSPECGLIVAKERLAKQEAKKDRERKQALKSRRDWMKDAQVAVNAYVRERDHDLPCISCGKWFDGTWQAGHYLSRGARPNLALDERNIAKQCMPCNVHLSGNQAAFRIGLIARIGLEEVERLEADHSPRKFDADELKAIRDEYRLKLKKLKEGK